MGNKRAAKDCVVVIENDPYSIRASRVGVGPLVNIWVHEDGNGGRGMILDFEQTEELIEGLNVLLDEIDDYGDLTPDQM